MPFLLPQRISLLNCIRSSKLSVDHLSGKLSQAFQNYYSALYVPPLWDFSHFQIFGQGPHFALCPYVSALGQVPFSVWYSKTLIELMAKDQNLSDQLHLFQQQNEGIRRPLQGHTGTYCVTSQCICIMVSRSSLFSLSRALRLQRLGQIMGISLF